MDPCDSDRLFSEIAALLRSSNCVGLPASRAFWSGRPRITADEIGMLILLSDGPRCAETLAQYLKRDLTCTQELLDALVAIGLVEHFGDRYRSTAATDLYCHALLEGNWKALSDDSG